MSTHEPTSETLGTADEIARLRARVEELEAALEYEARPSVPDGLALRKEERVDFNGEVRFTGDFNLLEGNAQNLSRRGICFQIRDRVQFPMCFELHGREVRRNALLAWIQRAGGSYLMGFEFEHPLGEDEFRGGSEG